ncbi:MAG: DUF11 domain-containing protein [Phycisphaerales bacterium]|nr:DUF11 domain-containing protein [Phycisphaerales bacterium]MCB9864479.1 DUF11 domain-containing protein [Phycisphaerales bacterium]
MFTRHGSGTLARCFVALCAVLTISQFAFGQSGATMATNTTFYPGGSQSGSVLALDRVHPSEVRVNAPFEYKLQIRNLTPGKVDNVVLVESIPSGFAVASISPEPTEKTGTTATWKIGSIAPRETKTVTFKGAATGLGELRGCANVTFSTEFCSSIRVVEPALELIKEAPAEVILCDPIPYRVIVRNTGTGVAEDVRIDDQLPSGLMTAEGQTSVVMNAGTLMAGQAREFTFSVRGSRTGVYTNTAVATEKGGQRAEASATTRVLQPVLQVTKSCPSERLLKFNAQFAITVTNVGDAPARNTILTDRFPAGLTFSGASDGGQLEGGLINWSLGTIEPGASRTVTVDAVCNQKGDFRNTVVAKSYCSEASAECSMRVKGVPAILLECIDVEDPIQVGQNITYIITILNQGTEVGTNVVIECEFPAEEEYVTAEGPTQHSVSGKIVRFEPIPVLAEKESQRYRVVGKGTGTGDIRFRVRLTSDQISPAVNEEESTHIY